MRKITKHDGLQKQAAFRQAALTIPYIVLTLTAVLYLRQCEAQSTDFTLSILHLNDVHARFEQTNVYSGRCTPGDEQNNRCYGGFARIHTAVKNLRAELPNSLFLAAGDYFQGTVWYTVHRYKAMAHFLNIINHDAMSLGNHEFDDGIPNLVHFLENASFPVLAANINDEREPTIQGKYAKSVVVEKSGRLIGIIGYLTTETLRIANTGKLDITDEITAVRQEAQRLQGEGVQIIIALGHAGYRKDVELAMQVEEVDVVVGGHTNTFLYTGEDPSTEVSVDQYPSVITQASGRQVPVVQAYAFGKYLGRLDVTFDANGEVVDWTGNPILLDNSIERDPFILSELQPWKIQINSIVAEEIGKTFVFLDGNRLSCRMRECNLGNLETDAVIHLNAKFPDDMEWARTSLAVINGGGIRSSIDERASNGSITMEDILTVAPFQNTIDIVELRGQDVRAMFEHSVEVYDPMALDPGGRFLQVSGFVVVYDISQPPGSRVVRLQARCVSCRVPTMEDVQDEDIYKIAMPSFIANGGDGYTVVRDRKIQHHLTGLLDTDVYSQYIQMVSPIYQGIENRILFIDSSSVCSDEGAPPQQALDEEDLQQLGMSDEGLAEDGLAELGPAHNPFLIAPHDMVNEMMTRHDVYFRKYYEKKLKKEKKRLLAEQNSLKVATHNLQERLEEIKRHELKVKLHEQILQGLDHLQDIDSAVTVIHAPVQIEEQVIQPIRSGTNVLPAPMTGGQNFGSLEFFPSGLRGATVTTLPGTRLEVGSPVRPSPEVLANVMKREMFQKERTDTRTSSASGIIQDQEIIAPSLEDAQVVDFLDALTQVRQIDPESHGFDFDIVNFGDRIIG